MGPVHAVPQVPPPFSNFGNFMYLIPSTNIPFQGRRLLGASRYLPDKPSEHHGSFLIGYLEHHAQYMTYMMRNGCDLRGGKET